MRKINKGTPPESFISLLASRKKPANWDEFHKKNKDIFHECRENILLFEQDCLCGYTELPIQEITDTHIDHYVKKSINPTYCFDWNNFIVATKDNSFGACFKDTNHCKCMSDYLAILNPVTDDCCSYFEYNSFGKIKARNGLDKKDKEKAEKTIEVFNLNHESLEERRQDIIIQFNSYLKGGLPPKEIQKALSSNGFRSVLEYELTTVI